MFYRDDQGRFPDYPSDDEGGSATIFQHEKPLEDADVPSSDEEAAQEAAAAAAAAAGGSGRGKGESGKGAAGKEADEDEGGYILKQSQFVKQLRKGHRTFCGKRCFEKKAQTQFQSSLISKTYGDRLTWIEQPSGNAAISGI